jgi:hypothetical protein
MCFTNLFRKWFRIEGKGRRLERGQLRGLLVDPRTFSGLPRHLKLITMSVIATIIE